MNFKWLSSNTRTSLLSLIIFLIAIWSLTFYFSHILREDIKLLLGEQQISTLSAVAEDINSEISSRLRALENVATKITPIILGNKSSMQKFLDDRLTLDSMFSGGLYVTELDGTAIADVPLSKGRIGINYIDRDYIAAPLKEGKSRIGQPAIGKKLKSPIIGMAAPIRDANGIVIGALAGVIDLGKPNFLDKITVYNYGKSGGYLVVAPQQRRIITGTDKRRIMEPSPPPGLYPLIDRFLAGYEGSGIGLNPLGLEVLASAKQIPVAGWYVSVALPTSEAFAPINSMQQRLLLAALILSLLACGTSWWVIKIRQENKLLEQAMANKLEEQAEELRHFNETLEQKVYEQTLELQKEHRRMEGIITGTNIGTWEWHVQTGETLFNGRWAEIIGYTLEELSPVSIETWMKFAHPEDLKASGELLEKHFRGELDYYECESRMQHRDGNWRWVLDRGKVATWSDDGKPLLMLGTHQDITEHKQSETALLTINRRFDQLAEQSGTVIWEIDPQGLLTYISHVSEIILGYHADEVIGKMHFYDMHPESIREEFKKLAFGMMERRESLLNVEHILQAKDGRVIWVSTNGIPILDNDGTLLGYRGSDTDITESRKLKEQLYQAQKMEAVGQLAGGLAHDFNNVLSIINGYSCILKMDIENNEQTEYIDKIQSASNRAAELTHSMLAFSRTQVMNPVLQDLNMLVSKVGTFVKKILGEDIVFKTVIKDTELPVNVDGGQIEQVIINLATNARDAMPDGGKLTISTDIMYINAPFIYGHGFEEPGGYAVITVTDTGQGMDEDTCKKIFEPFFTTKEVGKGTGLGLAMVQGIIKQHKGHVDVSSEPGFGTSFVILLPIVESENVGAGAEYSDTELSKGTETILIAEDDEDLREFSFKMLTRLGYKVILAVDGQDAVNKFSDNADAIQLIIMDMIMPHKSGKKAYDEILQIRPGTKALFSSGYSANIIQQQGELGKYAEFVSKPVQPAILLKKMREMLDGQQRQVPV